MRLKFDPVTRRFQRPARQKPPYKVIAVGVYDDQAEFLDRAADELQQSGLKANRSFVVQTLIRRLQQEMEGLPPEAILNVFIEKYLRRPLASASSREPKGPQATTAAGVGEPQLIARKRGAKRLAGD